METVINGRNYVGIKCGTFKALTLAGKMAPVIIAGLSGKDISEALASGTFLEDIAKDLTANISCEAKKIKADEHFVHHPEDLLPVIAWSAKEQVLPYFSAEAVQSISQALVPAMEDQAE
tara:strand:+ start:412 stop:768 length:357 start_codon:yes stop_codon:yes gene_type:complete